MTHEETTAGQEQEQEQDQGQVHGAVDRAEGCQAATGTVRWRAGRPTPGGCWRAWRGPDRQGRVPARDDQVRPGARHVRRADRPPRLRQGGCQPPQRPPSDCGKAAS